MSDTDSYISDQVRMHDRDRFLTALFAPPNLRPRLFTLYAFNSEIARIRETVSEPLIGQMRLQWWRDFLTRSESGALPPKGHPIAEALDETIKRCSLSYTDLLSVVDAREHDLQDTPFDQMSDLIAYCHQTSSSISLLGLQCLGVDDTPTKQAAEAAGLTWALTGVLRSVHHHAQMGRALLPKSLLEEAGLTIHDLQSQESNGRAAPVLQAIAREATAQLEAARAQSNDVDLRGIPVLLSVTLAGQYLRQMHKVSYNPHHPRIATQRPNIIALCWRAWRKKY